MANPTRPFSLNPFPGAAAGPVARISVNVALDATHLRAGWRLEAETGRLRLPPPATPRAADDLWRHTCCELFVKSAGAAGYREFNFSPSGEWAFYCFSGYRARVPCAMGDITPEITMSRTAAGVALDAVVPRAALPAGPLALAISAVIETTDGALSYWALAHPAPQPDFHHPDAFVLELR